jgi:phage shock protein PspC (stress-responsive transcriptional regulator)
MTPPSEPDAGQSNPGGPRSDAPNPPPQPPRDRPLTRSRSDRMLAGVAGGIARKYDFDPAYVRVAFVIITILSFGTSFVAYIVAWLVVPEADADEPALTTAVRHARRRPLDRRFWIGAVLLVAGANALADQYRFHFGPFSHVFWPMVLIGGGAAVLLLRDRDQYGPPRGPGSGATVHPATAPPAPTDPAAPPTPPPDDAGAGISDAPGAADSTFPPVPDDPPPPPPSAYPPSLPWPEAPPPRPPRVRRERSMLGRFTWSALLIVAGGAWLIDLTGLASIDVRVAFAVALGVVGVALLVGAWFGRSRGLIATGLLLTLFAGTLSAIDVPMRGDIGERIVRPVGTGQLDGRYRLAIGHLELDLTGTRLDGTRRKVVLTDAIGLIEVLVPANARVEIKARSDVGAVRVLGRPEISGTHSHIDVVDDPPGATGPRIVIDAHVGFGAIKVARTVEVAQ